MLYRSTDRLCRSGAPMENLCHSASFESDEKNAPSKSGTKHLGSLDICPPDGAAAPSERDATRGRPRLAKIVKHELLAAFCASQTATFLRSATLTSPSWLVNESVRSLLWAWATPKMR